MRTNLNYLPDKNKVSLVSLMRGNWNTQHVKTIYAEIVVMISTVSCATISKPNFLTKKPDNESWMAYHMGNGFFQQTSAHHDGRLGWVGLTKSPSYNCRGCSLLACLLCQTCGGRRRHMLCQTTKRERKRRGQRGREGISEDESVRGARLGWKETLSYIMSVLTGCFPQWNIELLERTCCRGVATLEIAELWIP